MKKIQSITLQVHANCDCDHLDYTYEEAQAGAHLDGQTMLHRLYLNKVFFKVSK